MDIKARIEELRDEHDSQSALRQQALQTAEAAQVNLIKIEGALEILRELLAEKKEGE